MLKQKAKQLTPEQQLLGAVLSILMKKGQIVMEIKAENEILVDRILDVIREEKGYSDQDEIEPEVEHQKAPTEATSKEEKQTPITEVEEVEIVDDNIVPDAVLEVAEEDEPTAEN